MKEISPAVFVLSQLLSLDGLAAAPLLEIEQSPSRAIQLRWTGNAGAFALEQSDQLGTQANWRAVAEAPQSAGGEISVSIQPVSSTRFYRLRSAGNALTTIVETSPTDGESTVAVTRETIFHLSSPLAPGSTVTTDDVSARFGARRLLTRAELSSDRKTVTLFFLENLPGSARIGVTLDGTDLGIDADGDGQPGGVYEMSFETLGITGLQGTAVVGHVFASEKSAGTNVPLANVTITVDGAEETLRTTTDAAGFFRLSPAPAGTFFVHVDGRTANGSHWPGGQYYPFVGKAWEAVAGRTNNLAGGSGEVFLPLIQADALQPVSAASETKITFAPSVLATNPALSGVEIIVPANSLFSDNGTRGGKVGIAPVPADRLPGPLPAGLKLPMVITIQTDGPSNFDVPVPVKFPNLPDPVTGVKLPAGAKTALWSFNHDTGRWEIQGSMTISADGLFAVSDAGVGVRQPGWHGAAPGSGGKGPQYYGPGGPNGGGRPCDPDDPDCECYITKLCKVSEIPGKSPYFCVLDCLGNAFSRLFNKKSKSPIEAGLRCIGGPDKCPNKPEDSLTPEQLACMDACQLPKSNYKYFNMKCEGDEDPCPNLGGLAVGPPKAQAVVGDLQAPVHDWIQEQLYFWRVQREYLVRLADTPKFVETPVAELPLIGAFLDSFSTFVGPQSENGIHLSATERTTLIGSPRPSQFTASEWAALIDRFDSLQGSPLPAAVAAAGQQLDFAINLLKARGWKNRLDGLFEGYLVLCASLAPEFASAEFPARSHYYYLKDHATDFVQRGRLSASGTFEGIVLAPDSMYTVAYYDPVTKNVGAAVFKTRSSGLISKILTAPLEPLQAGLADADNDSLPDLLEELLGTNPNSADSDGDGTPDAQEVFAGTNPLDGTPSALGVIAAADTPGNAIDVTTWDNFAAVADSEAGVALFDVTNPQSPVLLSQTDTPGKAVAVAGAGNRLAVSDRAAGVSLFDIANPNAPALIARPSFAPFSAGAIAFFNEQVIVATSDGALRLLNGSGETVQTIFLGEKLQDLLVRDGLLYVRAPDKLYVVTVTNQSLVTSNTIDAPGSIGAGDVRIRLSSSGNQLFAAHTRGYNVFDLSNPALPVLVTNVVGTQAGWKQIVADGSGLALAAVGANSIPGDGPHDVSLYSIGDAGTTSIFQATFPTSGNSYAVCLREGYALVASGSSGLLVVGYATPDTAGQAPSVNLVSFLTPGPTTQMSGQPFRLLANATDDVRIRNVEFYVNGVRVGNDSSSPYELDLRAPARAATNLSFTVQARAIDTGGNATLTAPQTVTLVPETVPPVLVSLKPTNGLASGPITFLPITAVFNEPLLATTGVTNNILLELIEGGFTSNVPVMPFLGPDNRITVNFAPIPDSDNERILRISFLTGITDLSGNGLDSPFRATYTLIPVNRLNQGTTWDLPGAWSKNELPGPLTPVVLGAEDHARNVTINSGSAFTLVSHDQITLQGALNLTRDGTFNGPIIITNQASLTAGGEVRFYGSVDIHTEFAGVSLRAFSAQNFRTLRVDKHVDAPLAFIGGGTLRNEPNATLDIPSGTLLYSEGNLENRGLISHSRDALALLAGKSFKNFGQVDVAAGTLEILGRSENFGVYSVAPNATLVLGNAGLYGLSAAESLHSFAASSRLEGAGVLQVRATQVQFDGSVDWNGKIRFDTSRASVAFNGITRLRKTLDLSGETSVFPPQKGNEIAFGGLSVQIEQPVKMGTNSTLTFSQLTPALVPGIDAQQSSRIAGSGVAIVTGQSVLNSAILGGGGVLQFDGPVQVANLSVAGPANPLAPKPVIFNGPVRMGNANLSSDSHSFNQAAIRVETNGVFDIVRNGRFANGGVTAGNFWFENRGILRHSASNLTQLELRNSFSGGGGSVGSVTNWGTVEILAGELRVPGVVQKAGMTLIKGGHLNGNATIEGGVFRLENGKYTGDLTFAGGQAEFPTGAVLPGALRVSAGELALPAQTVSVASFFQTNGTLRLTGGTLTVAGGSEVNQTGILTGFGTIAGAVDMRGAISPGSPIGTITVTQGYNHNSSARLVVDIGGLNPGVEYDQLKVNDLSISNGTLEVRLMNGFSPSLGAEFHIVVASGNQAPRPFKTVTGLELGAGKKFEVLYLPTGVKLRVVPA